MTKLTPRMSDEMVDAFIKSKKRENIFIRLSYLPNLFWGIAVLALVAIGWFLGVVTVFIFLAAGGGL